VEVRNYESFGFRGTNENAMSEWQNACIFPFTSSIICCDLIAFLADVAEYFGYMEVSIEWCSFLELNGFKIIAIYI